MVKVKNLNGTSVLKPSCKCENWLDHWKKNRYPKNDRIPSFCRCCKKRFSESELVGGHVTKENSSDKNHYIVPLCNSCNNSSNDKSFSVEEEDLISANCDYCRNK